VAASACGYAEFSDHKFTIRSTEFGGVDGQSYGLWLPPPAIAYKKIVCDVENGAAAPTIP
jgi:hypothetical protein